MKDTPLPLGYFESKYKLSRTTIWRFRKAGLTAICVGAKCFIREGDFIAFLKKKNSAVPLQEEAYD